MPRYLILLWVLLAGPALLAQVDQELVPLWADGPPSCAPAHETVIEPLNGGRGRKVASVGTPLIDVYLPVNYRHTGTGVVICPGGGYSVQAWDWEGTEMARWFNTQGVAAFVLRYRLPRETEPPCKDQVALADAQRALRLVRSRAEEWGLDPARVGIMGFSAGGHLASTAGTHFDAGDPAAGDPVEQESCRPDFMILMYPVISMDTTIAHMGSRRNLIGDSPSPEQVRTFSNERMVTAETPPTLLIHADDDGGVVPENSVRFYLALRQAGVPAALHIYEKGGHGFAFGEGKGSVEAWRETALAWMRGLGLLTRPE
ncbi:MAG: alpha/beta hydrolase [Bacteroidetes bacterium]|nr:MAG: alpha/beta hydrolase [Bacteroidota bacterium]